MKKYISDSEILNWNNRLKGTPYSVMPRYAHTSYPSIVFKQKIKSGLGSYIQDPQMESITLDPVIKFNFSFSVAKNRVDNFFHIFNKWFSNKVETKTYYENTNNQEKLSEISISHDIIESKKQSDHKLKDKEYTKFTYKFNARLSSIMIYIMFIEDTIDIFSKIYGYDESGNEHILTKYNIGDIVSKIGDQSENYLILDFDPIKLDKDFQIYYEICKIISRGQIIQYGEVEIVKESDITWSRDNRIDDILDK